MSEQQSITEEQYIEWRDMWMKLRPGKTPPTLEQMRKVMGLFDFTAAALLGLEE